MADLSGRLPTEIDSQQRFIQAAPATPSFLTSLANFGSEVASVADKAVTKLGQNATQRNALAEQAAHNAAAKGFEALFSDPSAAPAAPSVANTVTDDPGHNAAVGQAKAAAPAVVNQQTAAAQGKIDPAMAQAKALAVMRQVMAANPGHEAAVVSTFKELGVTNMITQQYQNAETGLEGQAKAQADTMNKLVDSAVNKWGYTNFYQMSPPDQAKTLATVGQLEANEADLDAKTKLASLTMQQHQLTTDEQTQVQKNTSQTLLGSALTYMTGSFGNLNKIMINMLGDPTLQSQPGRLEQLQSHLMNVALPALDAQYQNKMATILPYLSSEDRATLDSTYKTQRQSLVDMISGPQSIVQMNQRVLQNISDSYGIDYAKSAPMLMRLQKLIGAQAVGVLMSPAVIGNPTLSAMLKGELNNAMRDPSKMPSLTEFVQSLNGQIDPNSWDPEKMRAAAPAALASMTALAKDAPTFNGTDKQSHLALINSIKQTTGIAVDVVPQWGFGNVLMQGKALNTRGVYASLFDTTANRQDRTDAIQSWIPAATRTYETLSGMSSGDQFYNAKFDPHTMKWTAVWNGKMVQPSLNKNAADAGAFSLAEAASPGTYATQMTKPSPSSSVLEQVSTLNTMLNNLSSAAAAGWDGSLGKKVSYQEARRYYSTGELPESIKNPASMQKNGKTPEQNVDDAISHMLDFVNKLPTPKPMEDVSKMPLAGAVVSAAQAHGVPQDIALRLIYMESGGNPDVKPSSKGAVGPGQIMPTTAAAYGKDVSKLTPEQNVDLAMQILSDNYRKTGSWEDAISMYHSGHTLAEAAKRKLTDGNMATPAYTASIVGGPSSISEENLKRYGYVRY